jgi:hypothetical protein
MTQDRIDAAIAELPVVADAATEKADQPNPEATTESVEAVKEPEVVEKDVPKEAVDPDNKLGFPKPAQNAISRRDKQIGKLRAQNEAFQAQLSELQATIKKSQQPAVDPNQPQEEQFDNYGEYLKASIKYELAKDAPVAPQQNQTTPEQIQHYNHVVERVKTIEAQEVEFLKIAPDYKEVEAEYQDLIDQAPPELVNLFLEVENPPQAFYTLAKQGKLESLLEMPLHKAAIEIGKAVAAGVPQAKRISSAPTPIKPINGSGSGSKSLDAMNPNELREWLKS